MDGSAAAGTAFLDVEGGRIAYDDTGGDGPLVVCAPGMGELRSTFRHLVPQLTAAGYRVVTVDVRGHGETSTGWAAHGVAAVGADLVALVRAIDAGPARLVGHSMAAGAAVWAAARAPEAVAAVVLVGPFARDVRMSRLQRTAARLLFARPWGARAWGRWYDHLHVARPPDHAAQRTALVSNLAEPGRLEALQAMIAETKEDADTALSAVRAPALVVMGAGDPDFPDPAAEAALVAELVSGDTLLVEGAGHYPHSERHDVVGPEVVAFLRSRERVA